MNNWSVHVAFKKATQNNYSSHSKPSIIHLYAENELIPIEAWEDALIKAAKFVERWGEKYLPIFERVELELEKAKHQLRSLNKARSIANGDLDVIENKLRQQRYLFEP